MSGKVKWIQDTFLDPQNSDIKIIFRDLDKALQYPGHSFVFQQSKSTFFKTLLEEGKFKEGSTREIELREVDPLVAAHFLQYIYLEEFPACSETELLLLIKAGAMYDLPYLVNYCDERLSKKINVENAVYISETLLLLGGPQQTKKECVQVMAREAERFFRENLHLGLSSETLGQLLQRDDLQVYNERTVLSALWEWGKRRCSSKFLENTMENIAIVIDHHSSCVRWGLLSSEASSYTESGFPGYISKMKDLYSDDNIYKKKRVYY